jgi:hypothetical protein
MHKGRHGKWIIWSTYEETIFKFQGPPYTRAIINIEKANLAEDNNY